jgi:glucose/arabinose dehydrogenase
MSAPILVVFGNATRGWLALGFVAACCACTGGNAALPLDTLHLPPGFRIGVYADHVRNARSLALGPDNVVYVGTRRAGKVYALIDSNGDQRADDVVTVASGLHAPNGVTAHDGALYVAENHRVLRFPDIAKHLRERPSYQVIYDELPMQAHHGWRYARFGPDGKLYVAVDAPCNICEPDRDRYAAIRRMNPDGSGVEVYARGVRNSVGFDWDPRTGDLWFTDNGRDYLGDNRPPDELNHASAPGLDFGYPYCHGGDLPDPEYGRQAPCTRFTAPAVKLTPHGAALGMRFYTGTQFPSHYRSGVFIAQHGSWNRSEPIGYRVLFVPMRDGKPGDPEIFAQGWLDRGKAWGRPVDVLVMPDGALLVSDDRAGTVYRIAYENES